MSKIMPKLTFGQKCFLAFLVLLAMGITSIIPIMFFKKAAEINNQMEKEKEACTVSIIAVVEENFIWQRYNEGDNAYYYTPIFKFKYKDEYYRVKSKYDYNYEKYKKNEEVEIMINPAEPTCIYEAESEERNAGGIKATRIFGVVIIVITILPALGVISAFKKLKKTKEENTYSEHRDLNKKSDKGVIIGAFIICLGFFICSIVAVRSIQENKGKCTERVNAIVMDYKRTTSGTSKKRNVSTYVIYRFDYNGKTYDVESSKYDPDKLWEGAKMELLIDPDDPYNIYVEVDDNSSLFVGYFCIVLFGIIIFAMIYNAVRKKFKRPVLVSDTDYSNDMFNS